MRVRLPHIEQVTDRAVARKAAAAERQATELRGEAQKHATAADKLQEEKALRSRMATEAPTQHAREAQQRATHIKQARQRKAAERAREDAGQRAQSEYQYQPPTQRSGPSSKR